MKIYFLTVWLIFRLLDSVLQHCQSASNTGLLLMVTLINF